MSVLIAISEKKIFPQFSQKTDKDRKQYLIKIVKIQDLQDWSAQSALLTHEFGHTLGVLRHDDQIYKYNNLYFMWSKVML